MGDRKQKLSRAGAEELGQGVFESKAVYRFKDPATHTIVCECICWGEKNDSGMRVGQHQIFAERADCGTLNGISCQGGKLGDCEKKSVEIKAAPEQVREDLLVRDER